MDRAYLATVSNKAKTIKLADLINNTESICKYDSQFAAVYMKEKSLLLDVLGGGDEGLMSKARNIVDDYYMNNS